MLEKAKECDARRNETVGDVSNAETLASKPAYSKATHRAILALWVLRGIDRSTRLQISSIKWKSSTCALARIYLARRLYLEMLRQFTFGLLQRSRSTFR